MDLLHVYVGEQLGLYEGLAMAGPLTSGDLARRCNVDERYAREWLEQQAVAGIVTVDDADADPQRRRFALPAEHAEVLLDDDSLSYMMPLGLFLASVAQTMPQVLDAFRTGGGVPYDAYGPDLRRGIARINRPMFLNLLAQEWFPQVPRLVERLTADPAARVADVGCGSGWSAIAIAKGFPKVEVTGLDLDPSSVSDARRNAEDAGVGDRVSFEIRDAADPALAESFDLVCAFETIHDMRSSRGAAGDAGSSCTGRYGAGGRRKSRRHVHGRCRRRRALPVGLQCSPLPSHRDDSATGRRHRDHNANPGVPAVRSRGRVP